MFNLPFSKLIRIIGLLLLGFGLYCSPTSPSSQKNTLPTVELTSPVDGASAQDTSLYLEWASADSDNDNLTFDIYMDSTIHYSTGWPLKARGLKNEFYQVSGLKHNKRYYWRVCVKDGQDTVLSTTFDFSTKQKPITEETFAGLWQTDGYVNDTIWYHFVLLLNSNMTFSYTLKSAFDDSQVDTYTGYYSISSSTTIKFDYTTSSYTDAYYSYNFSSARNTLNLTHVSGFDFMNGKVGTKWPYLRQ